MRVGALVSLLVSLAGPAVAACDVGRVDLRNDSGKYRFSVDVADDPGERAQGLMHVESMPRFTGMLFVYEAPVSASFWMRNTLIPLDMIFVDPTGVVKNVHENAVPLSEETISGGDGILVVLEINGGLSRSLGIGPGTQMRHPAFESTTAVWPCEE